MGYAKTPPVLMYENAIYNLLSQQTDKTCCFIRLVLILLRIAIEQKNSTLGGTNPFHTPLKEMHVLG